MTNTNINTVREQTARLLATENITVIQDPQAQTAYFDLKDRTLCLPVWRDMTNAMYDMLIGHEVGHALFTPNGNGGWVDSAKAIAAGAGFAGVEAAERTAQTYLNIVEDARIERLIKERFPGLRRDFFTAYTEFAGRDLFSLKGRDPNTLGLADRLNIHFKIGFVQPIRFAAAEQAFVQRMETAVTWEDVVAIATDLFQFKDKKSSEPQTGGSGKSGVPQNGGSEGAQSGSSVADADGETEEGEGESQSGGTEGGTEGEQNSRPNGENRSDSDADSDASGGEAGTETGNAEGVNQTPVMPKAAETASALDAAMNQHRDTASGSTRQYSVVDSTLDSSDWVISFTDFMAAMRRWESGSLIGTPNYGGYAWGGGNKESEMRRSLNNSLQRAEEYISQFVDSTKDSVQAFVREFEMRKTADEHRRTVESKSGRLDMDQAWRYRISDNLFKTATTMRDGKSHGFVMFIDWSGSMANQMEQTMRQLFILFQFCRKVGVPFDVYAFGWGRNGEDLLPQGKQPNSGDREMGRFQRRLDPRSSTQLLHILSSRGSQRDLKDAFRYCLACSLLSDYYCPTPATLGGSTPLQGTLVIGRQIVRKFKEETKVQIVNTVILTDGDATDNIVSGGYWAGTPVIRENHREWAMDKGNEYNTTGLLLKWFRDTTDANIIGVFVTSHFTQAHSRQDASHAVLEAARKQFRKDGWCALPADGYSEYFLLRGKLVDENAAMDAFKQQSGTNMTATQIKSEYMKAVASRKATRGLIGRFVEIVA